MNSATQSVPVWQYAVLLLFMCCIAVTILWVTDLALVAIIDSYQPVRSYWLAALIFLLASSALLTFALKSSWEKQINFILAAVSVFFPLVVLTEIITLSLDITISTTQLLNPEFCSHLTEEVSSCSAAFSNAVFIMSIRALTTIVVVPSVFYFLLVKLKQRY